jgi:hypothetical protein
MAIPRTPRMRSSDERLTPLAGPIRRYGRGFTVADQSSARALAAAGAQIAVVERDVPRWVIFQCPCGCQELVSVNLDERVGPHWRLARRRGSITLIPSVWRETGCCSHFILWRNRVWMMRGWSFDTYKGELPKGMDPQLLTDWDRRRLERR